MPPEIQPAIDSLEELIQVFPKSEADATHWLVRVAQWVEDDLISDRLIRDWVEQRANAVIDTVKAHRGWESCVSAHAQNTSPSLEVLVPDLLDPAWPDHDPTIDKITDASLRKKAAKAQQPHWTLLVMTYLLPLHIFRARLPFEDAPRTVDFHLIHLELESAAPGGAGSGLLPAGGGMVLVETELSLAATRLDKSMSVTRNFARRVCGALKRARNDLLGLQRLVTAVHSPDFRSVRWFGTDFSFTTSQAIVVEILWDAWERASPEVGDGHLLERARCGNNATLRDIFKDHPAWGKMIIPGQTKGGRRLEAPEGRLDSRN